MTDSPNELDNTTYSLGKIINPKLRSYPFLNLFPKAVTISSAQKNINGYGGLLIVGWGGAGKTVLANNIAHEAHMSGHQIIRFYQHESEMSLGQGTRKYTDPDEFYANLSSLSEEESIRPTVVIIDSLEGYVNAVKEEPDWLPKKTYDFLGKLIDVKTDLEKRFAGKILFVATVNNPFRGVPLYETMNYCFASTVVGRIGAHYEIANLFVMDAPSHLFYRISDLETGEFVLIGEKNAPVFRGAEPILLHSI